MQKFNIDFDLLPVNVAVYKKVDNDFEFVAFNKMAEKTENICAEDLIGKKLTKVFPNIKKSGLFDILKRVDKDSETLVFDKSFYQDGIVKGWRKHYISKLDSGEIISFYIDYTVEKELETNLTKTEEELKIQKNFLKTVIDVIPDVIWIKDLNLNYIGCNAKFEELYGIKESELIGKSDFDLVDKKTAKFYRENDKLVLKSDHVVHSDDYWSFDNGRIQGYFETIKTTVKDSKGKIVGILGIARDITERVKREKELEQYALYDTLTGLSNRVNFLNKLESLIKDRVYKEKKHALMFIDLDNFKEINDTMGHSVGDQVLIQSAKRIKNSVREDDIVARFGGDEFVLVVKNISSEFVIDDIAKKILDNLSEAIEIKGKKFYIGASIGISLIPDDSKNIESLLSYADSAMYRAKEGGRNRYEFYTKDMSKKAFKRVVMENSIRTALENNEFEMYYQPQINTKTKKIVGAEALIRWNHPSLGVVSPSKFIPISEESGQIVEIGKWIIHRVMKDSLSFGKNGLNLKNISINLSIKQLNDANLISIIKNAINETQCNPKWIEFEVTETFAMSNPDNVMILLNKIKDLKCKISIDDFGTGYSSLQYLKKFPIDKLKIDQSFVKDIICDEDDEAIVKAVILIAKSMKLDVIAEGVEENHQKDMLINNGCDMAQGYLFSKPLPLKEFKDFVKKYNREYFNE